MSKTDNFLKRPTKIHRQWLRALDASLMGEPSPLELFGITEKRLEILESMGLVHYKSSLYQLTERGKLWLTK